MTETDAVFAAIGATTGTGSQAGRRRLLGTLFARATPAEQSFLTRLLAGELHQGALEGVMTEAVARAAGVDAAEVRRALMLGGSLPAVAEAALSAASAARRDQAAADGDRHWRSACERNARRSGQDHDRPIRGRPDRGRPDHRQTRPRRQIRRGGSDRDRPDHDRPARGG